MEKKFTKGEWFVKNNHVFCETGVVALNGSVRKIDETMQEGESWLAMRNRTELEREALKAEINANMNLIAAAPENTESNIYMTDTVNKCIDVLQRHILPDSTLTAEDAINELYGILDNAEIVEMLNLSKAAINKAIG